MDRISRREMLALSPLALAAAAHADAAKKVVSPFLQGNYAPVRDEVTLDGLKVVGSLPRGLEGMFVRNGPNPAHEPLGSYHWFDGDGMLHGLHLKGGKASYRNRYVRTEGLEEEKKAGKALYEGLNGLPDLRKVAAGKEGYKNAANTALAWHAGRLLALWEGGAPHEVKAPSLETKGRFDFGGKLKHGFTAHPKIDPETGEMYFFGYQPVKPYLMYSWANARGEIQRTLGIDLPSPVMMHDFAITSKHAVFLDLPMSFDFGRLLLGKPAFGFEPKRGARIGVMPRDGGKPQWFSIEPCFVFHVFNAHDDGDETVLTGCRMKSFPEEIVPPDRLNEKQLREYGSVPYRWRLDRKTGKVKEGPLHDEAADFPRINDSRTGRAARFGYSMKLSMDALLKLDLGKGVIARHELGKGRQSGEPVFAPRPGGKGEDDGWLLTFVYDAATEKSEMLVLDAATMKQEARVLLPRRVPHGFHGIWLAGV
jgi:carotenoid cleavage dioxygenase